MPRAEHPEPNARPKSMIRKFPVGPDWPDIGAATAAAEAHLPSLGAQWSNSSVIVQYQNLAAGILLGILTPPVGPPAGANDVIFDGSWWTAPPT